MEISTSAIRYNGGETITVTGSGEPTKDTTVLVKDADGKIIHYDVFSSGSDGNLNYEFVTDETISIGTYSVIFKQENGSDAALFGIGKYPTTNIVALMEKTNFSIDSKAVLSIIGPSSSTFSIKILDSNDNIKSTDSILPSSTGKSKFTIDLDGFSSGIYRAVVSSTNIQDSVKFSVGLEGASGAISLVSTQEIYSPGESILVIGNTGSNARITLNLYDPAWNISVATETFSDSSGNFATNEIGIPINAELGIWKITAHSRLDTKSVEINVSIPLGLGLTLQIEETEFSTGDTISIKGVGQSNSNRLTVEIIDEDNQVVVSLETPITSDGTFSLPWTIPANISAGVYTITVSDAANSSSAEIFIQ